MIIVMGNNNIKSLIARFQKFVYEHDLTLEKVAKDLGLTHVTIARILNGDTLRPHPRTRYKIKKYLEGNGTRLDS